MRNIYQFKDPIRMVEGRHGNMLYNQHCHWIGKALELYGEYCEHEIDLFRKLIKPADVVWEIGANTGSQSTALSAMVPEGKFVGFEPQVELFKIFVANLALNNCENALPLNFALGENVAAGQTIQLPAINYHKPYNFGGVSLIGNELLSDSTVELRSIDSLNWLPAPNFIKLDVEGMEAMVLRDGRKTIQQQSPMMYIENDRVEKSSELIALLWEYGYDLYWHITPYFNPGNYFGNTHNIYGNTNSFNMLCIPVSSKIKVEGLVKIVDKDFHPLKKG